MKGESLKILIRKEEISRRVRELADRISRDYAGRTLLCIGILKGAFIFMADLLRHLSIDVEVDFVRISSYGQAMESSGRIVLTKDVEISVRGRDLLLVEDIVDTGLSLFYLIEELSKRGPRSLKTCVLIDKGERRRVDLSLDYVGFRVEEGFIVGYGLDFAERYRYLPDLCIIQS